MKYKEEEKVMTPQFLAWAYVRLQFIQVEYGGRNTGRDKNKFTFTKSQVSPHKMLINSMGTR